MEFNNENDFEQKNTDVADNENLSEQNVENAVVYDVDKSETVVETPAEVVQEPTQESVQEPVQEVKPQAPTREMVLRHKYFRSRLACSLLGLILSLFVLPGIVFSLIGFISAVRHLKTEKSQMLVWAKWLGLIGIILNGALILSLMFYTVYFFATGGTL